MGQSDDDVTCQARSAGRIWCSRPRHFAATSDAVKRYNRKGSKLVHDVNGRTRHASQGSTESSIIRLICSVQHLSVLGPILFALYAADLLRLIEQHGLHAHLYVDDTQVHGSCSPRDINVIQTRLPACLDELASRMTCSWLQLNSDKIELLWCHWCAAVRRQSEVPVTPLRVGTCLFSPTTPSVDAGLSGWTDVAKTNSACLQHFFDCEAFSGPNRRPFLGGWLSQPSWLWQCNFMWPFLQHAACRQLQSVVCAAARSMFCLRRSDRESPALTEIFWLSAADHVMFTVCMTLYCFTCRQCCTASPIWNQMSDQIVDWH